MKTIPVVFFGLAVSLAAVWLVIEIILAKDKQTLDPSCVLAGNFDQEIPDQRIIDKGLFQLWTYSHKDEGLRSFRVSTDKANYAVSPLALIPLRCGTPDYQCIAESKNGGPDKVEVIAKNGNSLLIATQAKKSFQLIPALVAEDHLRLSGPLKMCGKIPSTNSSQFFHMTNRVAFFDPYTSRLGIWSPQYSGTVVNEAPHEPEALFQLSRNGFEPTDCQAPAKSSIAQIFQVADKLIVFAASESGSIVKTYSLSGGFIPEELAPLDNLKVESIWPLAWDAVVVKTTQNENPAVLRWSRENGTWSLLPMKFDVSKPLNKFASLNALETLGISSRYFLAPENIALADSEKSLSLPQSSRQWRRTEIEDSSLFEGAEHSFIWARQEGDSIRLRSYQCH